jgi:hypothetical protein
MYQSLGHNRSLSDVLTTGGSCPPSGYRGVGLSTSSPGSTPSAPAPRPWPSPSYTSPTIPPTQSSDLRRWFSGLYRPLSAILTARDRVPPGGHGGAGQCFTAGYYPLGARAPSLAFTLPYLTCNPTQSSDSRR